MHVFFAFDDARRASDVVIFLKKGNITHDIAGILHCCSSKVQFLNKIYTIVQ